MYLKLCTIFIWIFIWRRVNSIIFKSIFEHTLDSKYFVDRTDFIKLLLHKFDQPRHPVFITAPSTFGKSTIISMLEDFFEARTYSNGTPIANYKETKNYEVFGRTYADGRLLNIMKDEEFVKEHMAKYPVIAINLRRIDGESHSSLLASMEDTISLAAKKFESIFDPSKNSTLIDIRRMIAGDYSDLAEEKRVTKVTASISTLSEHVSKYFGQPCIILFDEFDSLAEDLFNKPLALSELQEITETFETFVGVALKENTYLRAGFLTGRIRYGGIYSKRANNVRHIRFSSSEDLATLFGLSKTDVQDVYNRCKEPLPFTLDDLEDYFDGYEVQNSNVKVFSTSSVIRSLQGKELQPTWTPGTSEGALNAAFRMDNMGEAVINSFLGLHSLHFVREERIELENILYLKEYLQALQVGKFNVFLKKPEAYSNNFLQYLYELGYFTTKTEDLKTEIHVPNKEVREKLHRMIQKAVRQEYNIGIQAMDTHSLIPSRLWMTLREAIRSLQTHFKLFLTARRPKFGKKLMSKAYSTRVFYENLMLISRHE